jgi:hypothetical protein
MLDDPFFPRVKNLGYRIQMGEEIARIEFLICWRFVNEALERLQFSELQDPRYGMLDVPVVRNIVVIYWTKLPLCPCGNELEFV